MLVDIEYWNIQLLIDDISVSSSGSQISVIQQREKIEQLAGSEQDKDDRPDSTTDHSRKRDEEKQEVIIRLSFIELKLYWLTDILVWENTVSWCYNGWRRLRHFAW